MKKMAHARFEPMTSSVTDTCLIHYSTEFLKNKGGILLNKNYIIIIARPTY